MSQATANTLRREINESTYEDVKGYINSAVDKFIARYADKGCYDDRDELLQEARFIWLKKFSAGKYDPKRASFQTWTHLIVWGGLLEKLRLQAYRHNRFTRHHNVDMEMILDYRDFDCEAFYACLSDDAAIVAEMILEPTHELVMNARLLGDISDLGASVWEYLRVVLGWETSKIRSVWAEIRNVL